MPSTRSLASLPPRPPTPPKELSSTSEPSASRQDERTLVDTPSSTPLTPSTFAAEYFSSKAPSRGTKRKRVNFILTPIETRLTVTPSSSSTPLPNHTQNERAPLQPRQPNSATKPTKSILKAARSGLLSDGSLDFSDDLPRLDHGTPPTFRLDNLKMLDNVFKELAETDKSVRLGAYQSLCQTIRDRPQTLKLVEFKRQLRPLLDSVHHDLRNANGSDHRDRQIAVEALRLVQGLAMKEQFTDTSLASLLDWSLSALGEPATSKALVNNIMYFLTSIRSNGPFTPIRAAKLLDRLRDVDAHHQGKQIQTLRLEIISRLLAQSQPCMFSDARNWLRLLIDALLTDRRELCKQALTLGRQIAIDHGSAKEISKALVSLFQEQSFQNTEGEADHNSNTNAAVKYGKHVVCRLTDFLGDRKSADRVPQILAIVIMLCRHDLARFRSSEYWSHWLVLFQKCFNSGDASLKSQTYHAWRDLIWASHPEILLNPEVRRVLSRPIISRMEQKDRGKSGKDVELTFCTLIYYSLRPGSNMETLSTVWNEFIAKSLSLHTDSPSSKRHFAMKVFASLFSNQSQQIWDKDRLQRQEELDQDALLRLDPLWVRSNVDSVLQLWDNYIRKPVIGEMGEWNFEDQLTAWTSLVSSTAEPGRREVRPSNEAMKAVASLLSFAFGRLVDDEGKEGGAKDGEGLVESEEVEEEEVWGKEHAYRLALQMVDRLIARVDVLPLTQNVFCQQGTNVLFVGASPSNETGGVETKAALDLIQGFLAPPCSSGLMLPDCAENFANALNLRLRLAATPVASLQQLASFLEHCVCDFDEKSQDEELHSCSKGLIWKHIASHVPPLLRDCLNQSPRQLHPAGTSLAVAVEILIGGIKCGIASHDDWTLLLWNVVEEAVKAAGEAGLLMGVLSPLGAAISDICDWTGLSRTQQFLREFCQQMLQSVSRFPPDDDLATVQQKLWGDDEGDFDKKAELLLTIYQPLARLLSSEDGGCVVTGAKAWNKVQTMPGPLCIPGELFHALNRAALVTKVEFGNISQDSISQGPIAAPVGYVVKEVENEDMSATELSEEGDAQCSTVGENQLHSDSNTLEEDDAPQTPQVASPKATVQENGELIPSSPPDFCLPSLPSTQALSSEDLPDSAIDEDIVSSPPLPSDELLRMDSSPTPSRRVSRKQSEAKQQQQQQHSSSLRSTRSTPSENRQVEKPIPVKVSKAQRKREAQKQRQMIARKRSRLLDLTDESHSDNAVPSSRIVIDLDDIQDCIEVDTSRISRNTRSHHASQKAAATAVESASNREEDRTFTSPLAAQESAAKSKKRKRDVIQDTEQGNKRQKSPLCPHVEEMRPDASGGMLSTTASDILTRLKAILGDVQEMVFGRRESRAMRRTLNEIQSAVLDAEERADC